MSFLIKSRAPLHNRHCSSAPVGAVAASVASGKYQEEQLSDFKTILAKTGKGAIIARSMAEMLMKEERFRLLDFQSGVTDLSNDRIPGDDCVSLQYVKVLTREFEGAGLLKRSRRNNRWYVTPDDEQVNLFFSRIEDTPWGLTLEPAAESIRQTADNPEMYRECVELQRRLEKEIVRADPDAPFPKHQWRTVMFMLSSRAIRQIFVPSGTTIRGVKSDPRKFVLTLPERDDHLV